MTNKIDVLNDTLNIFKNGLYVKNGVTISIPHLEDTYKLAVVYLPEDFNEVLEEASDMQPLNREVYERYSEGTLNKDSFTVAIERNHEALYLPHQNTLVLNFASPRRPGGGVRKGATAQEEDLCRRSSLLLSLESKEAKAFYDYQRLHDTPLGTDAMILSRYVSIIKDQDNQLLDKPVNVSVLTCAAPDIRNSYDVSYEAYVDVLYNRILKMLQLAVIEGYQNLVLGAFGCGVFRNDPDLVAHLFRKALTNLNINGYDATYWFRRVDFAVLDRSDNLRNYKTFLKVFPETYFEDIKDYCTYFWNLDEDNAFLSNWYPSKFIIDDQEYSCVEQYMMAQKARLFNDTEIEKQILEAKSPRRYKELGRLVHNFNSTLWNQHRYDIVKKACEAKFDQNPELQTLLANTTGTIIVEASPLDSIWGIGLAANEITNVDPYLWPGTNLLGTILMEVREKYLDKAFFFDGCGNRMNLNCFNINRVYTRTVANEFDKQTDQAFTRQLLYYDYKNVKDTRSMQAMLSSLYVINEGGYVLTTPTYASQALYPYLEECVVQEIKANVDEFYSNIENQTSHQNTILFAVCFKYDKNTGQVHPVKLQNLPDFDLTKAKQVQEFKSL